MSCRFIFIDCTFVPARQVGVQYYTGVHPGTHGRKYIFKKIQWYYGIIIIRKSIQYSLFFISYTYINKYTYKL